MRKQKINSIYSEGQIIKSADDLDAYCINMMQVTWSRFASAEVEYEFRCRSDENLSDLLPEITSQINMLENVKFTDDQIAHLSLLGYLDKNFLQFLRDFTFDPKRYVRVFIEDNQLAIKIKGPWVKTILFEIPILSIVSEIRNRARFPAATAERVRKVLFEKVEYLKSEIKSRGLEGRYKLAEFGTRRRLSGEVQYQVVEYLAKELPGVFIGTSNHHLSREFNVPAIGTMSHGYLQSFQAIVHPRDSQRAALETWNNEFRGRLGIALTDCITTDAFLEDFDYMLATLYSGVRQDSGDEIEWGEKMTAHYKKLGIDGKGKDYVFSNALDFEKSLNVCEHFTVKTEKMNSTSFGIGTFLSNDLGDYINEQGTTYKPLSIVIKMVECNGRPVAKISDDEGKSMCNDAEYMAYLRKVFGLKSDE